jgi:DNA-directed RNA polymerase subunit RPC12/RpoP
MSDIEFIPAVCPNCNGELRVPKNRDVVKCMYCGYDIIIHEKNRVVVETRINIDNVMTLARTAEEGKNFESAYKYYSQILEQDVNLSEAWLGKGRCAGWISPTKTKHLQEAIVCIKKGIELGSDNQQLIEITAINLSKIILAYAKNIISYLMDTWQSNKVESNGIAGALVALPANLKIEENLNQEFLKDYTPVIVQGVLCAWRMYPKPDVQNNIHQIMTTIQASRVLKKETKISFEQQIYGNPASSQSK